MILERSYILHYRNEYGFQISYIIKITRDEERE